MPEALGSVELTPAAVGTVDTGNRSRAHRRTPPPLCLVQLGQSLSTRSLPELERVVERISASRSERIFRDIPGIAELVVLRSCHRLEVYAVLEDEGDLPKLRRSLGGPASDWTLRRGPEAVEHLFRVAAGLESTAVGEAEVRAQVVGASHRVLSRHPRPLLRPLMEAAARAVPPAPRSHLDAPPSIAGLVASRIRALGSGNGARKPQVLVLGSGIVGRRVAELLNGSARVTLVYHHRKPSADLLRRVHALAVPWTRLADELRSAQVVVAAAKGGGYAISPSDLSEGGAPHLSLAFDLGLPRNLDPKLASRPGLDLWDLERLRRETPSMAVSKGVEVHLRSAAERAYQAFASKGFEPLLAELWRKAEEVRREELEGALRHAPHLSPEERLVLERLSERVMRRLLSVPTRRLRRLSETGSDPELVRLALLLFDDRE